MSEQVLITKEKLNNVANKILNITGETSGQTLDELDTTLTEVNAEIATQEGLIAQLQAAVNSLPEAGGGGSGNIETCTVTYDPFSPAAAGNYQIKYTDSTGKINTTNYNPMQTIEIVCQKNTLIFFEGIPVTPKITAEDASPWSKFYGGNLVIAVTSNTIIET
jgi:hypothetical protein